MDLLNGMLQKDQDEFRRICNKLINVCFICRQNQATRSDFYFIEKYKEKFEELLGVLGYRLEMNDEYGVVHTNRQNLKLYESVILLILRILFDEKKRELSVSDEVIVNLGDIQDKFLSLKIRDKMIDKTTMGNALRLFRRYQLIELLESDLKNEESRVLIYNSILMAVRVEDIKSVYEKVDSYRKGKLKDEEADQTETD